MTPQDLTELRRKVQDKIDRDQGITLSPRLVRDVLRAMDGLFDVAAYSLTPNPTVDVFLVSHRGMFQVIDQDNEVVFEAITTNELLCKLAEWRGNR